jgi:sulfate/thiosulfate-binding protein
MAETWPGLALLLVIAALGCQPAAGDRDHPDAVLTISAFSVVREAYDKALLPGFSRWYEARWGRPVRVEASYGASGAQSRAVVEGFEADVVVFSMADDVERLRRAGLITHDYEVAPYHGLVSHSVVVFAVRPGNPKAIHDWADLARRDVDVLTANPNTSGGAIWNIAGLYGAAQREPAKTQFGVADPSEALARVLGRVEIMDRSGRDSVQTFERGMGDVVITYENEIVVGQRAGRRYDQVTPHATLRIDNPAALVDVYVDQHRRRELAETFLQYLRSPEAQRIFAEAGLRPVDPEVAAESKGKVPEVSNLFTMDDLGGFTKLKEKLFSPAGAYTRALREAVARR